MPLEAVHHATPRALAARWAPPLLQGAALALIVLALARPQRPLPRPAADHGLGIDIMLVLDVSRSMLAVDIDPNRIEAAKRTARKFVESRAQDRLGLVVFGGGPLLACPLTLDAEALVERLASVEAGMAGPEGTALGEGIASAVNHLRHGKAKSRVMILLTDGRGNIGVDAVTAAKTAAAEGIKIYAIGVAKKGESLMPVQHPQLGTVMARIEDDLDEELLAEVASITGGRFWRAASLKDLREVFAEIDRLEKSDVKLLSSAAREDAFRPLLLLALFFLAAETALAQSVLLRWP
jgi:Ca-activated chloride channel family protein